MPASDDSTVTAEYKRGLELARAGSFFEAHEAFEAAWRAAAPGDRDFFQGLVHAVVFAYQAARGNAVGAERQREKSIRRLESYQPAYRGLDVANLLVALAGAETDLVERFVQVDTEPGVLVEEEKQTESDQRRA